MSARRQLSAGARVGLRLAAGVLVLPVPFTAGAAGAASPDGVRTAEVGGDADGDALLDDWEINGYDADDDGDIDVDLPAMGADPMHKDIFVEMDYMGAEASCPCHLPLAADLKRIVNAFKTSPHADNPDGKQGIRIHLDAGAARGGKYDLGGGNLVPHDADLNPYRAEINAIKATNFDPDRAKIFHYMLWAHNYNGGSSSGVSLGIPADTFIVTLGAWPQHGSSNAKVGTFIHELGHNLGLRHGGTDDRNYKPNYLSLMSYAFQIEGVPRTSGSGYFGYSKSALPTLVESTLTEADGLDDSAARKFRTSWWCGGALVTTPGSAADPIDWDCDGSIDGGLVVNDINNDGSHTGLVSAQDWGNLEYDGGAIGAGATAPGSADQTDELTLEEYASQ